MQEGKWFARERDPVGSCRGKSARLQGSLIGPISKRDLCDAEFRLKNFKRDRARFIVRCIWWRALIQRARACLICDFTDLIAQREASELPFCLKLLKVHFQRSEICREQSEMKKLNENIAGLRGLASISVVFLHLYNGPKDNGWFTVQESMSSQLVDFFFLAQAYWVEVFFMISGYLITETLVRHRDITQFAWNRFWRIYPTYFLLTNAIFYASIILGLEVISNPNGFSIKSIYTVNSLMLSGVLPHPAYLNVAWSLSYELVFYILSASAFFIWPKRLFVLRAALCLVAVVLVYFYPRAAFFFTGYFVYASRSLLDTSNLRRLCQALSVPGVFIVIFLLEAASRNAAPNDFDAYYAAAFLLSFPVFHGLITDRRFPTSFLRTRVFQFLGMISYGLYLWHPCVEFVAKKIVLVTLPGAGPLYKIILLAIIVLPSSIVAAALNFKIIETMLPRYVHRFSKQRRSSTA
jgi:peptidoglycan/LPS O-acetylase OafA/YrhL